MTVATSSAIACGGPSAAARRAHVDHGDKRIQKNRPQSFNDESLLLRPNATQWALI